MSSPRPAAPVTPAAAHGTPGHAPPGSPRPATLRRLGALWSFAEQVILGPIRDGRPRPATWPPWLRPVGAIALTVFAVLLALSLFSAQVRGLLPLTVFTEEVAAPAAVVPLLFFALTFVVALIQAAALRGLLLLRLVGLATTGTAFTVTQTLGGVRGLLIAGVGIALVAVLVAFRRRRPPVWWEFPLLLALAAAVMLVPLLFVTDPILFTPQRGLVLIAVTSTVAIAGMPVLVLAGYAPADVALRVGEWMDTRLSASVRGSLPWVAVVLVLVTVLSALQVANSRPLTVLHPAYLLRGAPTFALGALLAIPVLRLAWRARGHRSLDSVETLRSSWEPGAFATAFAMAAIFLPLPAGMVLQTVGIALEDPELVSAANVAVASPTVWWYPPLATALIGVGLWVAGLVRARRGEQALGLVGALFLSAAAIELLALLTGLPVSPSIDGTAGIGLLTGLALLVAALLRRANPVPGLLLVLLSLVYQHRLLVSDPLTELVTVVGLGATLFGLVWEALTVWEFIDGDSPAFPFPSRVLLYLAGILLGAITTAWLALTRMRGGVLDTATTADYGDGLLGLPAYAAVAVVIALAGVRALRRAPGR